MSDERWPALLLDGREDTCATLQMSSQVVGKIARARAAPVNHGWAIALDVTARGLTTRTHARNAARPSVEAPDVVAPDSRPARCADERGPRRTGGPANFATYCFDPAGGS